MKRLRPDQVPYPCPGCGLVIKLTLRPADGVQRSCEGCGGLHTEVPVVGACPQCERLVEQTVMVVLGGF